jgi:subtilisin family serine protease
VIAVSVNTATAHESQPGDTTLTVRSAWRLAAVRLAWALALFAGTVFSLDAAPTQVPGRIIVKQRREVPDDTFASRLKTRGVSRQRAIGRLNLHVLRVGEENAGAVLAQLRNDPEVEYAEPDWIALPAYLPNDNLIVSGQAWHLQKVQAYQAWDFTSGDSGTIIAILDSGIQAGHPDLAGRVLPGYDFVNDDADPADDLGHGTAVAGVAVAVANNGAGSAGLASRCSALPVRVVNPSGFAAYSDIIEGIRYAVDRGARIINISIAGEAASLALQEAVNYAWSNNVVVVAAAGNAGNNTPQYPAACEHVVSVAATEADDSPASFSSFGTYVSIAAPGRGIWTTQLDTAIPYGAWSGTSFASPIVAATLALAASANHSLSNTQLVSLIEQTADSLVAVSSGSFGRGRVNACRALAAAIASLPSRGVSAWLLRPLNEAAFPVGSVIPLEAGVFDRSGSGIVGVQYVANGLPVAAASTAPFAAEWLPAGLGTFSVQAVAMNQQGLCATSPPVSIRVVGIETGPPSIYITGGPANGARLTSPAMVVTGTAADDTELDHVEWQLNNAPAVRAEGVAAWMAQIALVAGKNTVRFRSVDRSGNSSPDLVRSVTCACLTPVRILTNGIGRVTPDLDGRSLEVGKTYTVKAVPGAGQIFAGWSGAEGGLPSLTFTMRSNLVLTASFVPSPFPPVKGTYTGLVLDSDGVLPENSGCFSFRLTAMGQFTGQLTLAGSRRGFHGRFGLDGQAVFTVARGPQPPLLVTLRLDLTNRSDKVLGSVADTQRASGLEGDRNVFDPLSNPAQQAGTRSFVLEEGAAAGANLAATGASLIRRSGAASLRGWLSDGRAFTRSTTLARDGDCPFYLSLNRGTEVVVGWLNFPPGPVPAAGGTVVWVRTGTNAFATTLQVAAKR